MAYPVLIKPTPKDLPGFFKLEKQPIITQLKALLRDAQVQLERLLETVNSPVSLDRLDWRYMRQLDTIEARVLTFWRAVEHINSVAQTELMSAIHDEGLGLVTAWQTEVSQNKKLYAWIKRWSMHRDYLKLDAAQQQVLQHLLQQFELSGIHLPTRQQKKYQTLALGLAKDQAIFETNIIRSSLESSVHVENAYQLRGLPERVVVVAAERAREVGRPGWLFQLNGPNVQSIMTYAEDRVLRQAYYTAWVTRASEKTAYDNGALMYQILKKRHELSRLTQFKHYAERSLADNKMAASPEEVLNFLTRLAQAARPHAQKEFKTLQAFAETLGHEGALQAWDIAYYSEKLRHKEFGLDEEKIRAYFPLPQVIKGLCRFLNEQFNIRLQEVLLPEVWDPAVTVLEIQGQDSIRRGYLYLDLHTRPNKRSGAWVQEYTQRRWCEDSTLELPSAFLVCNFAPPVKEEPALLTHDEVLTLFHEMGHALHHTLSQVNEPSVSGMQVPWDAVEFPSQFLEAFPWEPIILKQLSAHYQTGESLPRSVIQSLNQSRRFQSGLQLIRQLELALFDFQLHCHFNPQQGSEQIQTCLATVREQVRVFPAAIFDRFEHSFGHIFSGGYAAGYYSYLWAEVLAADAFNRFFEESLKKGIIDPKIGQEFVESVLEKGGSVEILELFKRFRKRAPTQHAFLKQKGLLEETS